MESSFDDDDAKMVIVTTDNETESPTSPSQSPPQSPEPQSNFQKDQTMSCNYDDDYANVNAANASNDNNAEIMFTMDTMMTKLEQELTENTEETENVDASDLGEGSAEEISAEIAEIIRVNTVPEYAVNVIQESVACDDEGEVKDLSSNTETEEPMVVDLEDEPDSKVVETKSEGNVETEEPEEGEDLEDGELEDDEDDDEPVVLKVEKVTTNKVKEPKITLPSSTDNKDRFSSRRSSSEAKEKEKKRHSHHHHTDENGVKPKRSRLDPMGPILPEEEDECYLFMRGGSPSSSPKGATAYQERSVLHGQRPPDLFDIVLDDDDSHGKHARRGRSPPGNRRRREEVPRPPRDRDRGGPPRSDRRPEARSLGDKMMNAAVKSDTICTYYMQGKCQKSHEECSYSHNAVPPRKMELCKFWMMECCAKKEKCLYLHNDFPCKFYHTGLICKAAEKCKFSHKPLNEVTKAVLLKHIETAPKEILGDFPRLNRNGALTLINKMESRILGKLEKERKEKAKQRGSKDEREQSDHPRRSRWEQPTSDDNEKLQELMEEAGIGGFYKETLEGVSPNEKIKQENQQRNLPPNFNKHQPPPKIPLLQQPPPPIVPVVPPPTTAPSPNRFQPHVVHNPALANVLANLNIPSTTIDANLVQQQQQTKETPQNNGIITSNSTSVPVVSVDDKSLLNLNLSNSNEPSSKEPVLTEPPEHLPPMQRELFLRIQQQQMKHENKKQDTDDEYEQIDDRGWYSSDDEEPATKVKVKEEKVNQDLDFSSVLSAIRQTAAAASNSNTSSPSARPASPPKNNELVRGDVDLRNMQQSSRAGPFGDTDFRLPTQRPEFKDIDLRLSNSTTPSASSKPSTASSPPPMLFKNLPTGLAKEIDASLKSHPPMEWKVHLVADVRKPDYSYIRHSMQPSQILMDPRLGPRNPSTGGILDISGPASPPPQQQPQQQQLAPPATIPGGDVITDPRVNRRGQQQSQQQQPAAGGLLPGQGLLGEHPRFPRDPRSANVPGMMTQPPPNWPTNLPPPDLTQAALAQLLAAQQLGLPLFPFPGAPGAPNLPFGQDFAAAQQQQANQHLQRHPSPYGGGNRGSSSWERYSQGGGNRHSQPHHAAGLSPPL